MRRRLGAFLDEGSEIEGKYTCSGTVMLDAKLRGEIISKDTLVVGSKAIIEATVRAAVVIVHGEIAGTVIATDRVELKAGGRIVGTVETPSLLMESGAVHDGECRMTRPKSAEPQLSVVVPIKA